MPDEEDKFVNVQFASVELDQRQYWQDGGQHTWELVGSINFTDYQIDTDFGPLRISVNAARLNLNFNNCEMRQLDAGYRRQVEEQKRDELSREETTSGKLTGGLKSKIGIGMKGVSGDASASGEVSGSKSWSEEKTQKRINVRHLVTFLKRDTQTGAIEWDISEPDGRGLKGEVIGETDEFGGRIGTVRSANRSGWKILPSITFYPHAELVVPNSLTPARAKEIEKLQKKKEKEIKRKLSIVSVLLSKEVRHVPLEPLVVESDSTDGDAR